MHIDWFDFFNPIFASYFFGWRMINKNTMSLAFTSNNLHFLSPIRAYRFRSYRAWRHSKGSIYRAYRAYRAYCAHRAHRSLSVSSDRSFRS